jgi:hypothetical protein
MRGRLRRLAALKAAAAAVGLVSTAKATTDLSDAPVGENTGHRGRVRQRRLPESSESSPVRRDTAALAEVVREKAPRKPERRGRWWAVAVCRRPGRAKRSADGAEAAWEGVVPGRMANGARSTCAVAGCSDGSEFSLPRAWFFFILCSETYSISQDVPG